MNPRLLQRLARAGVAARTAWLMCGVAILVFVALELLYRGQGALRRSLGTAQRGEPVDSYVEDPWFHTYRDEQREANAGVHWAPYVHWRRASYQGQYLIIDSLERRRTVQPALTGQRRRQLFMFGGSTMWGAFQPDSLTIPSLMAARLAARGATDVAVTNFGETGYVVTQELLALMLALRRGARPDVVVFYDGINEVYAATQAGPTGVPLNEANRDADFRRGRALALTANDGTALITLAVHAAHRSRLLQRLSQLTSRNGQSARPGDPDSLAAELVTLYAATAELIEAWSRAYGFRVLYFWQPTLHTTRKRLTAFEQALVQRTEASAFESRARALHRASVDRIGVAMRAHAPRRFVDLTPLFLSDTATVYLDEFGHTTAAANDAIAAAMLDPVLTALRGAPR